MYYSVKSLIFKHILPIRKYSFLLALLIPFISEANSKMVKGYIISQNNDTVARQLQVDADIFGQFNESKLYHEVEIMNELGVLQTLSPADIKGFGFVYKDKQYAFISKPVDKSGKLLFVEPLILGPKATLYIYKELSYMTNEYHFTLEKQDGSYLCISDFSTLESFREHLKTFFADNKEVISLIDLSFHSTSKIEKDVTKVVREVNSDKRSLLATSH